MAYITITSVEDGQKMELQVACLQAQTNVSQELKDRLRRIILEVRGDAPRADEIERMLAKQVRLNATLTAALRTFPEDQVKAAILQAKQQYPFLDTPKGSGEVHGELDRA